MIVVIADDLSGAAELAGAAIVRGLTAEVQLGFSAESNADVVCVDTNTRSLSADEASSEVTSVVRRIAAVAPEWIYKKCDSVLRGNVLAEIRAIMAAANLPRATLISANPSRGRIVRGGEYFINGTPLNETDFGHDPEHPRRTARVADLLGGNLAGIRSPDASRTADLDLCAAETTAGTLAAGGVEFFEAMLRCRTAERPPPCSPPPTHQGSTLLVCGSAAAWAGGRGAQARSHHVTVVEMPEELFALQPDSAAMTAWASDIAGSLRRDKFVLVAIGRTELVRKVLPVQLAERLAAAVTLAFNRQFPNRICAEGGATAATLARAFHWTRLRAERQMAGGVVILKPFIEQAPEFIIKVGSYDWPPEIWNS